MLPGKHNYEEYLLRLPIFDMSGRDGAASLHRSPPGEWVWVECDVSNSRRLAGPCFVELDSSLRRNS